VGLCDSAADFEAFAQSCQALCPAFGPDAFTLRPDGGEALAWAPEQGAIR